MPLLKSSSKKAVGKNIQTELAAGKPYKQSVAIALATAAAAEEHKHNKSKKPKAA